MLTAGLADRIGDSTEFCLIVFIRRLVTPAPAAPAPSPATPAPSPQDSPARATL